MVGDSSRIAVGRLDPVHDRHGDVHQHDVRLLVADELDRGTAVGGAPDDADAAVGRENRLERLREEAVVVGDHNADMVVGHRGLR